MPFQYPDQPKHGFKAFFLTFIVVLFSHLLMAQGPDTLDINSFATRINIAASYSPTIILMKDMNGDGGTDMVVLNKQIGTLSVYRNQLLGGGISFAPKVDYTTVSSAVDLAIGDLNGDGLPEVVVANKTTNNVSIFNNISAGGMITLAAKTDRPAGTSPGGVAIGDVNMDGVADIIVSNTSIGKISTLQNMTGGASYTYSRFEFPTGTNASRPDYVTMADIDGDDKPDYVFSDSTHGTVSVLRNISLNNSLNIEPIITFPTGAGARHVEIGDLDGDGKPELVVSAYGTTHAAEVLRNTSVPGSISFEPTIDFGSLSTNKPNGSYRISMGDLDGDGKADLVAACPSRFELNILKNTSTGSVLSFNQPLPFSYPSSWPFSVVVGDLDNDGKPDIVTANSAQNNLSIYRNQIGDTIKMPVVSSFLPNRAGRGTVITIRGRNFADITSVKFGGAPAVSFAVVSDSILTAIVDTGATGTVGVTNSRGEGSATGFAFTNAPILTLVAPLSGPVGTQVTITGSNFNTIPDSNIVYFGPVRAVVNSATAHSLTVTVPAGTTMQPINVTTAGFTGYSVFPFNVTFPGGDIGFTEGAFTPQAKYKGLQSPVNSCIADLDNDGKPDVALVNKAGNRGISIFRNKSVADSLVFQPQPELMGDQVPTYIAAGDLDGDGLIDLAAVNTQATLTVFRNTGSAGNISFAAKQAWSTRAAPTFLTIGDVDGDGRPDVLTLSANQAFVSVYRNTGTRGNISFAAPIDIATTDHGYPLSVMLRDFTNTGKTDMIVSSSDNNQRWCSIHTNTSMPGTVQFGARFHMPSSIDPVWTAMQNINNDGLIDLLFSDRSGTVYAGRYNGMTFSPSLIVQSPDLTGSHGLVSEDLNGDGKPDIAITSHTSGNAFVLRNTGQGNAVAFTLSPAYNTSTNGPVYINAGDLDGDSKPDLVVISDTDSSIVFLRNTINTGSVLASGSNPVTGPVTNEVRVDSTVQLVNGSPYVQRHYDIEPQNNAATATATLTLYFTQKDFDNFNAYPGHGPDLPQHPTDSAGKASLRVYQYHGFSASGQPGTYSDSAVVINPADDKIVWDTAALSWKVTFDVQGFSGFFISSVGFTYKEVAAPLITVTGSAQVCQGDSVVLISSIATNNQWYKDGAAITGAIAKTYRATTTGTYTATALVNDVWTKVSLGHAITVKPVPAKPVVMQSGTDLLSSAAAGNQWYRNGALIAGATAQTYRPSEMGDYSVRVTVNGCMSVNSENYSFSPTGVINIDGTHFISLTPNPVADFMQLNFNLAGVNNLTVQVVDMQGKTVQVFRSQSAGARLPVQELITGMYLARIYSNNGKLSYTMKFLKQ